MTALWRVLSQYPDFRRLFGGNSISSIGSSLTTVALPLTAVSYLGASPVELGLLGAATFLPNLLFGIPAGLWISRLPYRRVLVIADVLRFVLLGSVPILAAFGLLAIWQLYVVIFLAGTCTLFDAVAAESFTQMLVPQSSRHSANSSMALSLSAVTTIGTAIGGALVQALTAPGAIVADAISFLLSAYWKSRIKASGHRRPSGRASESLTRQGLAGFRVIFGHPTTRPIIIAAMIGALGGQIQNVVLVLYLVRDLHLSATAVGVVLAIAGLAGVTSALAAGSIIAKLGVGPTFIIGMLLASLAGFVLAAATGPLPLVLIILVAAQTLRGSGPSLYGITQQSMRQTLIPPELLSRALATWRLLVYGVQPIGAVVGGILGELIGLRGALCVSSSFMIIGTITGFSSPLRKLKIF